MPRSAALTDNSTRRCSSFRWRRKSHRLGCCLSKVLFHRLWKAKTAIKHRLLEEVKRQSELITFHRKVKHWVTQKQTCNYDCGKSYQRPKACLPSIENVCVNSYIQRSCWSCCQSFFRRRSTTPLETGSHPPHNSGRGMRWSLSGVQIAGSTLMLTSSWPAGGSWHVQWPRAGIYVLELWQSINRLIEHLLKCLSWRQSKKGLQIKSHEWKQRLLWSGRNQVSWCCFI